MAKLQLRRRLSLPPPPARCQMSTSLPPGALALEAQAPDRPRSAPCVSPSRDSASPPPSLLQTKHSGANTQTHSVCRRPADPTELLLQRICSHIHTQAHTHLWHSHRLIAAPYRRRNVSAAPLHYISDLSTVERALPTLAHTHRCVCFFFSPDRIVTLLRGREQPGECFRASSRIKWKAAL